VHNLTAQKVMLALITLGFFIAAPWLTSEALSGNTTPLLSLAGVGLLLLFVYGLGDRCWMIIPFCLSIEGNLNFLPLNFSIQELTIIAVLVFVVFRNIFGINFGWKLGPAVLWIPLAGVAAVVFYHWISSGDIGIKLLGGTGWGGRKYFKVFITALSIPLLASFPGIRIQDLQKVPLLYFLGTFVDIVPDLLTTFIPASAPYVYRVYSGVNLSEFGDSLKGNFVGEKAITRFGTLAKLGSALGLASLCYFPARTWLQPNRLWVLPAILIGGLLCAISGFRNTIFRYGVSLMAGLFAMLRFRAFLLLPLVAAAALAIALTQGSVFNYPLQIQRALSFLPGDWNAKAASEAKGSSEWRAKITTLFFQEFFQKAPFIGKGYHYNANLAKQETDVYLSIAQRQQDDRDEFSEARRFIEMRQPHEGPVHILLVTGSVGAFFFVAYCLALLLYSFGSVIRTPSWQVSPIQIWAVASLTPQILGFFLVFGDLTNFLLQVCPVSSLLYRFDRLKATAIANPTVPLQSSELNYEREPSLRQPAPYIN
jgi:hypothetical protein